MNLYDEDYHEKYRQYTKEKRYAEYIGKVVEDLQDKIQSKNREQIDKIMKEQFPMPTFKIEEQK